MHHLNLKTQLKKNSGPLNDTFDFIPLHLTFQGDVPLSFLICKYNFSTKGRATKHYDQLSV